MTTKPQEGQPECSPIAVIRDLQSGKLSPNALSSEARCACVEHLRGEGYAVAEIAEIFKVSTRTIRRDILQIRQAHAVQQDPALLSQAVGQLMQHAELAISRLKAIAAFTDQVTKTAEKEKNDDE
jgi:transposase